MERTSMGTIRELLRLHHECGLSQREISAALGVGTSTVCRLLQRAATAGLSWPLAAATEEAALRAALYPVSREAGTHLEPDWARIVADLDRKPARRRVKLTRRQIWHEYCEEAEASGREAYSYSQFCHRLSRGREGPSAPVAMRFEYEPGVWGMSDFSGKTLGLRQADGGEKDVEIFVSCLCYSRLTYAEAVPDQSARHWSLAHRRAFEYYGGAPQRQRIDNLKAGVIRPGREDFVLHEMFRECTRHYGVAVLPARPGKPRDKGPMEEAVQAVQRAVLLVLRDGVFFSLAEMNAAIGQELDVLNNRPMPAYGASRRARFEERERAALRSLPPEPWEWSEWLGTRKVGPDCHVRFQRNNYSVPAAWMGQRLEVRRSAQVLEFFASRDGQRVAVHPVATGINRYQTQEAHMQQWQGIMQASKGARFEDWLLAEAGKLGSHAEAWALRCLASRDFPPQAFNAVRGMIELARKHPPQRVDEACAEALARERFTSGFLRSWLQRGNAARSGAPPPGGRRPDPIPVHGNIRGEAYYRKALQAPGEGSSS